MVGNRKEIKAMSFGTFTEDGRAYVVHTPFPPSPFTNKLFNDEITMDINTRMQGCGIFMAPDFSSTEYRGFANRFYVNCDGKPYVLCRGKGNTYACEHRLYQTEVTEAFDGFLAKIRVMIPVRGARELWTATLENTSDKPISLSFFSLFPFSGVIMQQEARMDPEKKALYHTGHPYYCFYDDKEKAEKKRLYRFAVSDIVPDGYECNPLRFFGTDDMEEMPAAVIENRLIDGSFEQERAVPVSAMQHVFRLAPGETARVNFCLGAEKKYEDMMNVSEHFPDVEEERNKLISLWEERCSAFMIDTPNKELNYLTNYWLKRQLTFFARLNRGGTYCPIRNQMQDYLGYAILDPAKALEYTIKILKRQHYDGFLKMYYNTNGAPEANLCLVNHSDSPIWLILCTIEVIEKSGDSSLYDLPVEYMDSDVKESILTHLLKSARYMMNKIGPHGLCLMLDGDWNDPVNGPGRGGKGESTWNSMAFTYALERLLDVHYDEEIAAFRRTLMENINRYCWDGEWYAAGINDDGIPYGVHTDKDAQKFLNAQTWALISGVATGERADKVVATIESMGNEFGYVLIDPPFSGYNPIWGRVSVKQRGTTENGSVYCHSVMFKILGDCRRGDGEAAVDTLLRVLPTNPEHNETKSLQIPIYYANYYFGYKDENYGRSSFHYRTGSVAWHIWTLLEYILGLRCSAAHGVEYKPCVPASWKNYSVTRRFAGKTCTLTVKDGKGEITEN